MENYKKLSLLLLISYVIMYVIMYFNVYETGHVYFSVSRLYMVAMMVCPMAVLMVLFMPVMYPNKALNAFITSAGMVVFITAFIFLRLQVFVSDKEYMRTMIPHHSSAILTSEKATLTNPEVLELAEEIIKTQKAEIAEMKEKLKNKK